MVHNSSMARWRAPLLSGRSVGGRVLTDADVPDALRVCAQVPVDSVLAAARVATAAEVGLRRAGGVLWGFERDGELVAVCWSGANLVPVVPPGAEEAIGAFARLARSASRRSSSIVGERSAVLGLWEQLSGHWPAPREIRADQPSLVIDSEPLAAPDPAVRRTHAGEYDEVLPACIAMFTEEVGYSPASGPSGPYEVRVRHLIEQGRSFARFDGDPPHVLFKAEIGALACGVAQVQGVWVRPDRRGEGVAVAGMAAVVQHVRRSMAPTVSLYVNDYNAPALAAYRRVGFRQVGSYATVLF